MTDKELLGLAAKAIGYDLHVNKVDATQLWKDGAYVCFWKPLDDDGDALRLAVKLKLLVDIGNLETEATDGKFAKECEIIKDDPYASTRRAIVRAAAEIGKTL